MAIRLSGSVYTMNPLRSRADQLVIGSDGNLMPFGMGTAQGAPEPVTLPQGAVIVPGLHDAHQHWFFAIFGEDTVSLEGVSDLVKAKDLIKEQCERQKTGCILVINWNSAILPKSKLTQKWLDGIGKGRRHCMVLNRSFHEALLSSSFEYYLKCIGINSYEGEIKNGFAQEEPVWMALGAIQMDADILRAALIRRQDAMLSAGFTSVVEKGLNGTTVLAALESLYRSGDLVIPCDAHVLTYMLRQHRNLGAWKTGALNLCGIKQVTDGAFGNGLACIAGHGTYPDGGDGLLMLKQEQLLADVRQARKLGYTRVAAHCIGTHAIRATADAFGFVLRELGRDASGLTLSFEHFESPEPDIVRRVAALQSMGASIEVVPTAGFSEDIEVYADRLPPEVLSRINPYGELMAEGVRWREGTDGIITGDNPWWGMAQAMGRGGPQAITFPELFARHIGEPLTVGGRADFVVLDRDPFADPTCLAQVQVLETWIAGKRVWSRNATTK